MATQFIMSRTSFGRTLSPLFDVAILAKIKQAKAEGKGRKTKKLEEIGWSRLQMHASKNVENKQIGLSTDVIDVRDQHKSLKTSYSLI